MTDVMQLLEIMGVWGRYSCEGSLKAFLLKRDEVDMRFPVDVSFCQGTEALKINGKCRIYAE